MRVVHARLDPGVEVLIAHGAQGGLAVDLVVLGSADDFAGDHDANLANAGDVWVKEAMIDFLGSQGLRESLARGVDHGIGDLNGFGEDGAHSDTWKNVHVVALARVVGMMLASGVGEGEGLKGGAGGEERSTVSVGDGRFKVALGLGGWVGQREDDGSGVPVSHLAEDLWGEDSADGRQAHKDGGLDVVDDLLQGLELLALVVGSGEVGLVFGQLVATVHGDETLGVHKVEARAGLILGHALTDEEVDDLTRNTHTRTPGSEEHGTLVLAGDTRALHSVDQAAQNHRSGSLDVIIEACVGVPISLESGERVLEVLELNDDTKNFPLPLAPVRFRKICDN